MTMRISIRGAALTQVVRVVHAGVHALPGLRGVRVARVARDEYALVHGVLCRDTLADCTGADNCQQQSKRTMQDSILIYSVHQSSSCGKEIWYGCSDFFAT